MTRTVADRRAFLGRCAALGLGGTLLPGVLWARLADGAEITKETVRAAAELAGVDFDDAKAEAMVERLRQQEGQLRALHAAPLANEVPPAVALHLVPPPATAASRAAATPAFADRVKARPATDVDLAFAPVAHLAQLLRARRVSSVELTELALARLEAHDPRLQCVISLTRDRALTQARAADAALARGAPRSVLHGIPWGAKDLLAVRGYRTTWGAGPFRDQVIDADATVVRRLDAAGAVLVAKLTLGELAQGDVWFGGTTKNPWKLDQGSSGSSAGSASATAAGLVPFAIGSETLGSISSPATRCGVTGLRPTYGRVPRTGAMALSWSMDKLGPLCRTVEDCALVLDLIRGADGADPAAVDAPYAWRPDRHPRTLRVGFFEKPFELPETDPADPKRTLHATRVFDLAALDVLRRMGVRLVPVEVPEFPYDAMRIILSAEAAAAFDELTRGGRDAELVQQGPFAWANTFRVSRFIPAVDYVNANRLRTLAIRAWNRLFEEVDVIVTPTTYAGTSQLVATNLTGHPAVIVPNGFRDDGTPVSLTFLAGHFREELALAAAHWYQRETGFHLRRPPAFA